MGLDMCGGGIADIFRGGCSEWSYHAGGRDINGYADSWFEMEEDDLLRRRLEKKKVKHIEEERLFLHTHTHTHTHTHP